MVSNDRESTYSQLLDRAAATSVYNLRIQNMLITIHKCIHINFYPAYLKDLLTLRSMVYSPRGTDILSLCRPASTSYGLHSFKHFACKTWNSLPETIRTESTLAGFKRLIRTISFHTVSCKTNANEIRRITRIFDKNKRTFIWSDISTIFWETYCLRDNDISPHTAIFRAVPARFRGT